MGIDVDYLVIGGGAMGSSAAYSLAAAGHEVLLVERFSAGHLHGASHGATRNFNPAYSEPAYLRLLQRANHLWDDLSAEAGVQLLNRTGLVNHGIVNEQRATHRSLKAAGFDSALLTVQQAEEKFAGMRFETETLFIPSGGQIHADLAVSSLQDLAVRGGASLLQNHQITAIDVVDDSLVRVRVEGPDGPITIKARHVTSTVGAWTQTLLGQLVKLPAIHVTEEHPVHFAQTALPAHWPGFNHILDPRREIGSKVFGPIYGMRTPGDGIKVGWHGSGRVVDPDARPHELIPEQIEALQDYARNWLPGVDPEVYAPVSCTYANTEDENFILDRFGPITVGAGFSGHGFKFVPAIGEYLAQLSAGERHTEPLFAATRKTARPVFLERRHSVGIR